MTQTSKWILLKNIRQQLFLTVSEKQVFAFACKDGNTFRILRGRTCFVSAGDPGAQGIPGLMGAPGPQGFRGDSGDPGPKGKSTFSLQFPNQEFHANNLFSLSFIFLGDKGPAGPSGIKGW